MFLEGDACDLPSLSHLGGSYDCVLAANLICRLNDPHKFLTGVARYVTPGGILVITSPYSFSNEFTPKVRRMLNCFVFRKITLQHSK